MTSQAPAAALPVIALACSFGSYVSLVCLAPFWIDRFPPGPLLQTVLGTTFGVLGVCACFWLALAFVFQWISDHGPQMHSRASPVPRPRVLGTAVALSGVWVAVIVPLTGVLATHVRRHEMWFFLAHALSVILLAVIMALEIWGMAALTRVP